MKIGIECEGRFKGLKTLFVDADEVRTVTHGQLKQVHQVYISDLTNKLNLHKIRFVSPKQLIPAITVERTKLDHFSPDHINVILRVENDQVWYLKSTDQVKFHDLETHVSPQPVVLSFTREQMIETYREDFSKDEVLK